MSEVPETYFQIKTITWSEFSFKSPILLQDENGPCPLIANVNTLLLKFEYDSQQNGSIETNAIVSGINGLRSQLLNQPNSKIKLEKLLALVGDLIMSITETSPEYEESASKLLDLLPKLHTGLIVNPNLVTGEFPENEISTILFTKLFNLNFKHGWVLDADVKLIQNLETFDKVQVSLLENVQQQTEQEGSSSEIVNYESTRKWLEDNKSQMTNFGLEKLKHTLDENEFSIFFRNNHFNTLFKGPGGRLYLLITDSSFFKSKKIIWQSLTSISGKDDIFYTGDFFPILDEDIVNIGDMGDQIDDDDETYTLTKQLQEQEDQRMAQEMHDRYNKSRTTNKSKNTSNTKPKSKSTEEGKKMKGCVIC